MSNAILGALVSGHIEDSIFDLENMQVNRDDGSYPFFLLRNQLREKGFNLHTLDYFTKNEISPSFYLYFDNNMSRIVTPRGIKKYVIAFENPLICLENNSEALIEANIVFSWQYNLKHEQLVPVFMPNKKNASIIDGFKNRNIFSCVIAGNKTVINPDERELYSERIKTIRWFEKNARHDFALYGSQWEQPAQLYGKLGRLFTKIIGILGRAVKYKFFPSYKGRVDFKKDIYTKTRFSICYENTTGLDGYITEKIFDSFFAGCIPVYWGAPDVDKFIPKNCFIDRRQFKTNKELYDFLKEMTEDEYILYQEAIHYFLKSNDFLPFTADFFAERLSTSIYNDLMEK